jgi:hypothetical protein
MKILLLGMSGLCAGGTAYYMSDSPDFDRVVKKSPAQVYAAFSRLAEQGTVTPPDQGGPGPRVSFQVQKVDGRSIHYEVRFDDRPVVEADLTFEPAGEEGRQTHMTAELDFDASGLGPEFQTQGGVALGMLQERAIDGEFARMMGNLVDDVEAGRPLRSLRPGDMGVRDTSRAELNPRFRRSRAEARQRAAVRPMNDPRPMVDPNSAADNYLNNGRQDRNWDR